LESEDIKNGNDEHYRVAFAHAAVGMAVTDLQGTYLEANPAFASITGYTEDELHSLNFAATTHPDDFNANRELTDRMLRGEISSFVLEKRYVRKDGNVVWVQNSVSLVRDSDGKPSKQIVLTEDITKRKQSEQELRERARREELLNTIGQAIRMNREPVEIQKVAVQALGQALGADRCYFAIYDLTNSIVNIAAEIHRSDLPPVCGVHRFPNTAEMFQELYNNKPTSIIPDAHNSTLSPQTLANMRSLQLRSRMSAALVDGKGLMATLTAAMSEVPRDWTLQEVDLIEAVATQMRTAVESARLQLREHRIATELQDALQPALPPSITGLDAACYAKPALDEAAIGGDFYDIFRLDKELYAIVIGDVSGKGLSAAAQLATVRNMLRGVLYQYRSPAQAVTSLNTILTVNDLLAGFVTAFVGIYDGVSGNITYVCCGHEPGIICRASDRTMELLKTTGPPLAAAENATYTEETIQLLDGDILMLYTDGMSEAGPTRSTMIGIEGLRDLVAGINPDESVNAAAERIVAEVYAYAQEIFRDDVCVLMMRRLASPRTS
jgi:PAS domain S-box-containing protein